MGAQSIHVILIYIFLQGLIKINFLWLNKACHCLAVVLRNPDSFSIMSAVL